MHDAHINHMNELIYELSVPFLAVFGKINQQLENIFIEFNKSTWDVDANIRVKWWERPNRRFIGKIDHDNACPYMRYYLRSRFGIRTNAVLIKIGSNTNDVDVPTLYKFIMKSEDDYIKLFILLNCGISQ